MPSQARKGILTAMRRLISWTTRLEDGRRREVRVAVAAKTIKWQVKCTGDERWDYDVHPTRDDWDRVEEALTRRAGRGQSVEHVDAFRQMRAASGM